MILDKWTCTWLFLIVVLKISESEEVRYWQGKTYVVWHATMEEGVWRGHDYAGKSGWNLAHVYRFCFGRCLVLRQYYAEWSPYILFRAFVRILCSKSWMKLWSTIHMAIMASIRREGLFILKDLEKLIQTNLCKLQLSIDTSSTMFKSLRKLLQ